MGGHGTHLGVSELGRISAGQRWVLSVAVVVTILGGAIRLAGIDEIGLKGSDNTTYTEIARHWSEGDRVFHIGATHVMYRPVVYATYAAAIRLLGYHDWSIKIVNASLDTINIVLVFLLAWILSRRDPWAAATAAIIYALLPFPILISRSELTHTLSTTTLLVALILLSLAWSAEHRTARLLLSGLAGVATGLSALTHEEMIFAAAAPTLFLLLVPRDRGGGVRAHAIEAIRSAGSYLLGTLVVAHGMLQIHQADAQTRATGIVEHRVTEAQYLRFVERPLKFGWNAVTGSSSTIVAVLVIILAAVLITRFAIRLKHRPSRESGPRFPIADLPMWTVIGYIVLYSFFFTYYAARLFLPLIPLLIVWLVVRSNSLLTESAGRRLAHGILAVLTVILVVANLGHIVTFRESMASRFETWTPFSPATDLGIGDGWSTLYEELTRMSWNRERFEELGGLVNENARLLIGASVYHPFAGRRSLQVGYYFGDNAIHLFDHDEPIEQLIEEKKVAFVLFTPLQAVERPPDGWGSWQRYLYEGRWGPHEAVTLGKSLGFADGEYTVDGEFERLRAEMRRRGARIILGRRDLLTMRPDWNDPVSYIVWVLDPASWPELEREIEATSRSLRLASGGRVKEALDLLEATEADTSDWGRVRIRLTAARILAEVDRPAKARRAVTDALSLLPRNTTVATALREAYPDPAATSEMFDLFTDLHATNPGDRAVRDLLLGFALNLAEDAVEAGDRAGSVDAFGTIERLLEMPGSTRYNLAIADWCAATARDLVREGRTTEADAAVAAASTVDPEIRGRDARPQPTG